MHDSFFSISRDSNKNREGHWPGQNKQDTRFDSLISFFPKHHSVPSETGIELIPIFQASSLIPSTMRIVMRNAAARRDVWLCAMRIRIHHKDVEHSVNEFHAFTLPPLLLVGPWNYLKGVWRPPLCVYASIRPIDRRNRTRSLASISPLFLSLVVKLSIYQSNVSSLRSLHWSVAILIRCDVFFLFFFFQFFRASRSITLNCNE